MPIAKLAKNKKNSFKVFCFIYIYLLVFSNACLAKEKLTTINLVEITEAEEASQVGLETYLNSLNIDSAVKISLMNNPELRSDLQKLGVAESQLIKSKLFTNPQVSGELSFFDQTGGVDYEISIQKEILDIFFRPMRKGIGEAKLDLAKYQLSQVVLNKIFETKSSFIEYVYYKKAYELKLKSVELTELEAEVAQRQSIAGNINPLELYNHNLHNMLNENELSNFKADFIASEQNLKRILGLNEAELIIDDQIVYLDLAKNGDELSFEEVVGLAFTNSPELKSIEKSVTVNEKSLKLANWRTVPDFSLGAQVLDEPGPGRFWGPTITGDIPLFDRNQDQKAFYKVMLEKSKFDYKAQKVKLYSQLKIAYADLNAKKEISLKYRDFIFEQRKKLLAMTQLNYNFMLKDVYDLLQAKKNLIDAEIIYLESVKIYYQRKFEIMSLIGLTSYMEEEVNDKE